MLIFEIMPDILPGTVKIDLSESGIKQIEKHVLIQNLIR